MCMYIFLHHIKVTPINNDNVGFCLYVCSRQKKGNTYIFCNKYETVDHCFLHCHYVKEIWPELKKSHDISLRLKCFSHIPLWLLEWIDGASEFRCSVFPVAVWHIWENRNNADWIY